MNRDIQKTQRLKALQSKIKLLSILFIMLFLTSFASATLKSYDEKNKEVTLSSNFLFFNTGDIAKIQLKSDLNVQVGLGYQKVFEFHINSYKEYKDFIKGFDVYNIKKSNKLENKPIDLKYLTKELQAFPIYKEVCSLTKNGTRCSQVDSGEVEYKEVEVWKNLETIDVKVENVTISGWTDVKQGDYYEWIPTFIDVKVPEWATWTGNMSVGLVSYYKLDETSGTTAYDSLGTNNGTTSGATVNQTGKINKAYSFDGTNDQIILPQINLTSSFTISLWVNMDSLSNGPRFLESKNSQYYFWYNEANSRIVRGFKKSDGFMDHFYSYTPATSSWIYLTYIFDNDNDNTKLYINGVLVDTQSTTYSPVATAGTNTYIGSLPTTNFINGKIDEVGIWNRSLSATEVLILFNNGTGCQYGNESCYLVPPTVTLNSPINAYNSTSSSITFNATAVSTIGITNVSLYLDGILNETNTSGINNTDYIFTKTLSEGNHNWSITSCNTYGCTNSTTRTFSVDTIFPTFIINYPTSMLDYGYVNQTMQLNWSVTDTNLDKVWYNYNGTNITITGAISGTYNLSNITLYSKKNVTFYANDTFGNTNSTVWSWDYSIFENGRSYQNSSVIGKLETFSINVTGSPADYYLIYNGTPYASTKSGEIYNTTIQVPNIPNNYSFYWSFNNFTINTTSSTQSVGNISFYNCTSPSTSGLTLNFTTYSTVTNIPVNASFEGTFNFMLLGSTLLHNYTYQSINQGKSNWMFCLNSAGNNVTLDSFINYYGTDYLSRSYILEDAVIGNFTQNIPLYLDLTNETGVVTITVTDQNYNPVPGAVVNIQKWNVGTNTYATIGQFTTSSMGKGIINLYLNSIWYRSSVSLNDVLLAVTDVQKISSLDWPISVSIGVSNPYDLFGTVSHGLTFNNLTNITTFTFSDSSGYINKGCLTVQNSTSTGYITIYSSCVNSVSGTINYLLPSNGSYMIYGEVFLGGSYNGTSKITDSLSITLGSSNLVKVISPFGKVLSFIMIGTLALIGISMGSIILGVGLLFGGVVLCSSLGWINVNESILFSLIILIILVIFRLSRRYG